MSLSSHSQVIVVLGGKGYSYDPIYELTQVVHGATTTESYSYDAVGNRLSSLGVNPYSYNASNELTSTPSGSYTYDANGNTLADASGKIYTWDFENRLVQAVVPGTGTTTFKYDPFGRRIQKAARWAPPTTSIAAPTYWKKSITQETLSRGLPALRGLTRP